MYDLVIYKCSHLPSYSVTGLRGYGVTGLRRYRDTNDDRMVIVELTQKAIDLKDDIEKVPDEMYCKINGLELDELISLKKSLDKMLNQLGK